MSLIAKAKPVSNIPPLAAGTYTGICVGVVDVGEQLNEMRGEYAQKLELIFEIAGEKVEIKGEDGAAELKPRWISKDFTLSINPKSNLYKFVVPLMGRDLSASERDAFDISQLLRTAGLLAIECRQSKSDSSKSFNIITSAVALPRGMSVPAPESECLLFDIDRWDDETFKKLPEWLRSKIMKSTQYVKGHAGTAEYSFGAPSDAPADALPAAADF